MRPIAALYVETGGSYYGLPGVDPWDERRDARLYPGPHPAVAHPPCQRWGKLWAGQLRLAALQSEYAAACRWMDRGRFSRRADLLCRTGPVWPLRPEADLAAGLWRCDGRLAGTGLGHQQARVPTMGHRQARPGILQASRGTGVPGRRHGQLTKDWDAQALPRSAHINRTLCRACNNRTGDLMCDWKR